MWKREKEELRKQLDEISSSNKALAPLGHGQLTDIMAVATGKPPFKRRLQGGNHLYMMDFSIAYSMIIQKG